MKTFITIILLLSTLTVLSQNNSENRDKWKVGVTISPDIYFNSTSILTTEETGYRSLDPSGFNFTSGLVGQLSVNTNFDIGSGINYSRKDFSGTYYCNVCDFAVSPKPEPIKLRFIEIPIVVRYKIFDKKFDVYVDAGLTSGYLTNTINTRYEGTLSANKFQLGGQFGLGIDLDLGQRINLFLSSDYKQSFTNLLEGSNFKFRSVGFVTGVMYKINYNGDN